MSLTLGEKLRQAREERGFTLSEVAEQTRISSLYLESIENDDYRILPGGIFNKGFVKSYAKFVGISESEAISDYSALIAQSSDFEDQENPKVYRPEVLTDDRSSSSMIPTAILAAVILGLMTAGILFLVNYLRQPSDVPIADANRITNSNSAVSETPVVSSSPAGGIPDMTSLRVEVRTLSEPVALTATSDATVSNITLTPVSPARFEPKQSLKLRYSRSLASFVTLLINEKEIKLPAQPLVPRRSVIEFEINGENIAQIWTSGVISSEVPAAQPVAPSNTAQSGLAAPSPTPAAANVVTPTRPTPRPSGAANLANVARPVRTVQTPASPPNSNMSNRLP